MQSTKKINISAGAAEEDKPVDVLGVVSGENPTGLKRTKVTTIKERILYAGGGGGLRAKRNIDIVDKIYDKAERRTVN
jgi:hypothetical protein